MQILTKERYLENPCRASSIPYWKAKAIAVPDNIRIVHRDDRKVDGATDCIDEPYFRLSHDLRALSAPALPKGYSLCKPTLQEFVSHINSCYTSIGVTPSELEAYTIRQVYDPDLWLGVRDDSSGEIVASGIAELDREVGEGILEWIQVSENHRRRGLGRYLVTELLWRMKDKADFATVSGMCGNSTNPESLYRSCGFTGNDVWHVIRR